MATNLPELIAMMATPAPSDLRESSPLSSLASQSPPMSAYLPSPSSQAFSDVCPPDLELGSSTQISNTNNNNTPRSKKRKAQSDGVTETSSQTDQWDGSPPAKKKRRVDASNNLNASTSALDADGPSGAKNKKAEPGHELDASIGTVGDGGQPTVKKRRTVAPKRRITEYLDLRSSDGLDACPDDQRSQLNNLLKVLRTKKKIVVVAGAGISVSAGSK